jgi:hypothetical protein
MRQGKFVFCLVIALTCASVFAAEDVADKSDATPVDYSVAAAHLWGGQPSDWPENPKLVDAVTKTAEAAHKCSEAMKFVPHPVGTPPGPIAIIKYIQSVYSASVKIKHHEAFDSCIKAKSAQYKEFALEAREGV